MDFEHKKYNLEYKHREENKKHMSYEYELYFYDALRNGDVEYIDKICRQEHFAEMPGLGTLSNDPLRNVQYHVAISTALSARICIDGGLSLEEAFSLSDFYIQQLDACRTTLEVDNLSYKMNLDFAKRMNSIAKKKSRSKPINQCMNYIYIHLHEKIRVSDLAELVKLNKSHLSRLFKSETGYTIQEYITSEKIEEAKKLLKYSKLSCNDISHILSFASQSHFTNIFKKYTDMTPKVYREYFYHKEH